VACYKTIAACFLLYPISIYFLIKKSVIMTTQEIADRLAELCGRGDFETAQKELFSEDAVSIEPYATPAFEKETKGLQAIFEKGKKFGEMVEETYGNTLSEPLVAGNSIALKATMDMKMKGRERESMSELCVYTVKDGKIVSEQFFM
jgi:hypothetical protein